MNVHQKQINSSIVISRDMKKIIKAGLISGVLLLLLSLSGLYITLWVFPEIALQYFDPAFHVQGGRLTLFYFHPFVLSLALSMFWAKAKVFLTGSYFNRAIEFAMIYTMIAVFPMMWLLYSALNVPFSMLATWFFMSVIQGLAAALTFEKTNP